MVLQLSQSLDIANMSSRDDADRLASGNPKGEGLRKELPRGDGVGADGTTAYWKDEKTFVAEERRRREENAQHCQEHLFLSHCWRDRASQQRKRMAVAELSKPVKVGSCLALHTSDALECSVAVAAALFLPYTPWPSSPVTSPPLPSPPSAGRPCLAFTLPLPFLAPPPTLHINPTSILQVSLSFKHPCTYHHPCFPPPSLPPATASLPVACTTLPRYPLLPRSFHLVPGSTGLSLIATLWARRRAAPGISTGQIGLTCRQKGPFRGGKRSKRESRAPPSLLRSWTTHG